MTSYFIIWHSCNISWSPLWDQMPQFLYNPCLSPRWIFIFYFQLCICTHYSHLCVSFIDLVCQKWCDLTPGSETVRLNLILVGKTVTIYSAVFVQSPYGTLWDFVEEEPMCKHTGKSLPDWPWWPQTTSDRSKCCSSVTALHHYVNLLRLRFRAANCRWIGSECKQ